MSKVLSNLLGIPGNTQESSWLRPRLRACAPVAAMSVTLPSKPAGYSPASVLSPAGRGSSMTDGDGCGCGTAAIGVVASLSFAFSSLLRFLSFSILRWRRSFCLVSSSTFCLCCVRSSSACCFLNLQSHTRCVGFS